MPIGDMAVLQSMQLFQRKAEFSIEKQQAETALVKAKAFEIQAEARKTSLMEGGPKPLHGLGSVGHERVIIGS